MTIVTCIMISVCYLVSVYNVHMNILVALMFIQCLIFGKYICYVPVQINYTSFVRHSIRLHHIIR